MFSLKMVRITKMTQNIWTNAKNAQRLLQNTLHFSTSSINKGMLSNLSC